MQDLYLGMFFPPILKATQRRHVTGVPQHVTDVQMTGGTLLGVPSGSRVKLLCPAGASLLEALHGPKGFTDAPPAHTVSSRTLQTPFSLNPCEIEAARSRTRSRFWGFGAPGVQGSQAAPWHLLYGAVCPFHTHPKRKIIQLRGATVGTLCPVRWKEMR